MLNPNILNKMSELELLVAGCSDSLIRLKSEWSLIITAIKTLGPVMLLTRNEYVVHEKNGVYSNVKIMSSMGFVLDDLINLRLFISHWHQGFFVREKITNGESQSLQFFDRHGKAIHKIYLLELSDERILDNFISTFTSRDQLNALSK
ncbi:MAG: putative hemin transport protein [Cellvibrionaceae bacterium]|jgi:putative hemin transport protein